MKSLIKPLAKPRIKPAGGYVPISNIHVCLAWSAYHSGVLPRFYDFRVYLALHEVRARKMAASRTTIGRHRIKRRYVLDEAKLFKEVAKLVGGVGETQVRLALRRLIKAGLVQWKLDEIRFGGLSDVSTQTAADAAEMLRRIDHRFDVAERVVSIPRRMLKIICSEAKPSVAATALAIAMRCLWRRHGSLHDAGTCRASFVARVFGINKRSAKRARSDLRSSGWINLANPRRAYTIVNLDWCRNGSVSATETRETGECALPPRKRVVDHDLSPSLKQEPVPGYKNQNCTSRPSPGLWKKKPQLRNVLIEDLQSVERVGLLFEEAAGARLVPRSESGRLLVAGAAEHALRVARTNPCGLFATVLRKQLWDFISEEDEARALRRTKARSVFSPTKSMPGKMNSMVSATEEAIVTSLVSRVFDAWKARDEEHPRACPAQ